MPATEIKYHEPSSTIFCWDRSQDPCRAWSYPAHRPLPADAPDEVKSLAAQHWTPQVVAAAKERLVRARPPATPKPEVTLEGLRVEVAALAEKLDSLTTDTEN